MAQKALTLGKGKGALAHNNREYKAHNVDASRTPENIVYASQPIGQAYSDLFGEAVGRFNEKARSDRKINTSYFEHLFKQPPDSQAAKNVLVGKNKQKSFYEDLIQVGDMADSGIGTADRAVVAKCLDEYMRGWQQRNPNFHVFNAVLHMDEKTPHLHIDYIPVADSARGLSRQNGMAKALAQMGYDTRSGDDLGFAAWRKKERAVLEGICRMQGVEPKGPEKSRGVSLLPDAYKAQKDAQRAELAEGIETLENEKSRLEGEKTALEGEIKPLRDMKASLKAEVAREGQCLEGALQDAREAAQNRAELAEGIETLENEKSRLEGEKTALEGEIKPLRDMKARADQINPIGEDGKERHKVSKAMFGSKESVAVPKEDYDAMMEQSRAYRVNRPKIQAFEKREAAVKKREVAADGRAHELNALQNQLVAKYNEQLRLNQLYSKEKELASRLEIENLSLKTENSRLLSLVDALKEKAANLVENMTSIVKAVALLKFPWSDGKPNPYKIESPTPHQGRLMAAIENYGVKFAQEAGFPERAKEMQEKMGFSAGMEAQVKALEPKQRSSGYER